MDVSVLLDRLGRPVRAAIAGTGLFTATTVTRLWFYGLDYRVRETGYFRLDQFLSRHGFDVSGYLPKFLEHYVEMETIRDAAAFGARVFTSNLLLIEAAVIGAVLIAQLATTRARAWLAARLIPLALAVAFLPAIYYGVMAALFGSGATFVRVSCGTAALLMSLGLIYAMAGPIAGDHRRSALFRWVERIGLALAVIPIVGVIAASPLGQALPPPPSNAPNILLISIDSLRADHLSSYGYGRETSPNLDQLAEEGVRFEVVAAPTSWTLPSHLSLMTGLDVLGHGVSSDTQRLDPGVPTVAERLLESGYETAGVVGAPYLNARWSFSRGFQSYDDFSIGASGSGADHREITSPGTERIASEWLRQWADHGRTRPFFLFVHFWDVHYDYNPPSPFDQAFDTGYTGPVTGADFETDDEIRFGMDPAAVDFLVSQYDGEILYVDSHIGRLLGLLDSLGIAGDTAVVVTSDHGEEFFDHVDKGHRKTLYEEVTRVPLIMRLPGTIPAGTVVDKLVRTIDVAPTILRLAHTDDNVPFGSPHPLYAGRDLLPLIDGSGTSEQPRLAFMELQARTSNTSTDPGRPRRLAVRSAHQKFVLEDRGNAELYDLDADPEERTNLADGDVETSAGYRKMLRAWAEANSSVRTGEIHKGEQQQELLKGLGYVQ